MNNKRARFFPRHSLDDVCVSMQSDGFAVFILDRVENAQSFFIQAKDNFPMDPPISGNIHWDAFSDSLWGGLDACKSSKIALVIRDASAFRHADPPGCDTAVECIVEAATEVEQEKRREGIDDAQIVVIFGED